MMLALVLQQLLQCTYEAALNVTMRVIADDSTLMRYVPRMQTALAILQGAN